MSDVGQMLALVTRARDAHPRSSNGRRTTWSTQDERLQLWSKMMLSHLAELRNLTSTTQWQIAVSDEDDKAELQRLQNTWRTTARLPQPGRETEEMATEVVPRKEVAVVSNAFLLDHMAKHFKMTTELTRALNVLMQKSQGYLGCALVRLQPLHSCPV
eukprot:6477263-Amphidinium_carterae.1